jgi:hypothetical protein
MSTRLAIALLLLATTALADDLTIKTYKSFAELQADTTKKCELVSHDCEVCSVDAETKFVCSSVGTACQPKEWRCYEKKTEQ